MTAARLLALLLLCALGRAQDNSADDVDLSTPEIIDKYGYSVEEHFVTTHTGYILRCFRIPSNSSGGRSEGPVLMVHGLQASSDTWCSKKNQSLAFQIANAGRDVWLCNLRGNIYSRNHTFLDPNQSPFWTFSWHEIGVFDIPAIIDYILSVTGSRSVIYIGHSMGTTVFFVMSSERPEYTQKVSRAFLLAPVTFMKHVPHPAVRAAAPFSDIFLVTLGRALHYEIPPTGQWPPPGSDDPVQLAWAAAIGAFTGGFSRNKTSRGLQGGSVGQPVHYGQEVVSGCFCKFDRGLFGNRKEYGSFSPTDYNVSGIACPVIAMFSVADCLVGPEDVWHLWKVTPDNVKFYQVPGEDVSHKDFLIGANVSTVINQPILDAMDGEDIGATRDLGATPPRSKCALLKNNKSKESKSKESKSKENKSKKDKTQKASQTGVKAAKPQRRSSGRHLRV